MKCTAQVYSRREGWEDDTDFNGVSLKQPITADVPPADPLCLQPKWQRGVAWA